MKLKEIIQIEFRKIALELAKANNDEHDVLEKWLQSLQNIDDCCKERNRY